MSLTSFIETPEIKDRLQEEFTLPRIMEKREIIAPPISSQYQLVGTAFDYLLRFYIEKLNPKSIRREWIAESWLKNYSEVREKLGQDKKNIEVEAEKLIKKVKGLQSKYLTSKQNRIEKNLIKASIQLSYLDNMYRSSVYYDSLVQANPEDIIDLRKLLEIVDPKIFNSNNICLLNPIFGKTAKIMGGADADLLIDDMIIEIKTTKSFSIQRRDFNQLLGYYFLHKLDGVNNLPKPAPKITKLAIYFSRFAYLHIFDIDKIINKDKSLILANWFRDKAYAHYAKRKEYFKQSTLIA